MTRRPHLGPAVRVATLTAVLAASAAALLAGPLRAADPVLGGTWVTWWMLLPLFAVTEVVAVHVQARRESWSISFAEVPLVLGLVFCDPLGLAAANVLGSALGLLHRRQFGQKLGFNLALFAFEAALAQLLYRLALGSAGPMDARGLAAALATVIVANLVCALALTLVIWVKAGRFDRGVILDATGSNLVAAVTNTCVGLLIIVLAIRQPAALVLLLAVVGTSFLGFRAYFSLSQGHERLEALHRFTRGTAVTVRTDTVAEQVLHQARDVLAADVAELYLLGSAAQPALHLRLGHDGMQSLPEPGPLWWQPALTGKAVLLAVADADRADIRQGLAAPLQVRGEVTGVLVLADRAHHLDAFTDGDLRLFELLANHAAVSLQNARLVDRLRAEAAAQQYQSLHDALTKLPNRRHFIGLVDAQLADDPDVGVVLLDLDGFQHINDAFGHATGDLLLVEVGRRLLTHPGAGSSTVARLGNDEFAVLLSHVADEADALHRVRSIEAVFDAAFPVSEGRIAVRASIGLALAPAHGVTAELLVRHADAAMYAAKRDHVGYRVYDPANDLNSNRRLTLLGDLGEAIAAQQLQVYYQPKVEPGSGAALGAEALVRWTHPQHGPISPDEFIPLAEHSGLIHPLTALVLDAALKQCRLWRKQGHQLTVAVNLSTRSLTDRDLPGKVKDALERADLPASALTLEITETAVMTDLPQALRILGQLRSIGVRLSIDDFGTGQSSLAYLKTLPVHEVKIDQSFIRELAEQDSGDIAIIRAAIELGHALGLQVVAEGVEDAATCARLAEWGCDSIQGYLIGRPMPAADFSAWLNRPPAPRKPSGSQSAVALDRSCA